MLYRLSGLPKRLSSVNNCCANAPLPAWYRECSRQQRKAFDESLVAHFIAQNQWSRSMAGLQDIQAFAEPRLREHLKACMGYEQTSESSFSARRRHLEALRHASDSLEHGRSQLTLAGAGELLAEDLRQAQQSLGEITGAFSSDDLLGRIFSSFCIGK